MKMFFNIHKFKNLLPRKTQNNANGYEDVFVLSLALRAYGMGK